MIVRDLGQFRNSMKPERSSEKNVEMIYYIVRKFREVTDIKIIPSRYAKTFIHVNDSHRIYLIFSTK